jgi:hypothetical protein
MTSQSPRIYIYKITFEEVLYYYYGVHKEKKFGEYYMGSPYTHKWCWNFYTPKKEILQFFDFTDEGWIEANEIETRLIKPFYNTDKWCLNENCGGVVSLEVNRETGRRVGKQNYELGIGFHSLTTEERKENGRKNGKMQYENKLGMFSLTPEERSEIGKMTYLLGIGVHGLTKEQKSENGKKASQTQKELGIGVYGLTKEQRSQNGKKAAKTNKKNKTSIYELTPEQLSENGKKGGKKTSSQKWMCEETGHISTPAGLSNYQRARGIDTSKRRRIS